MVEANNNFAFNLYSELKGSADNTFFSPQSISSVGAMLYEGARGETADQIRNVFGFPENIEECRSYFSQLQQRLNRPGREYTLQTANALWAEQKYKFLKEFVDIVTSYYGGEARNVDLIKDAEGSRKLINEWVERNTEHRITNMLGPGSLNTLTRLILTNAICFKGYWANQFKKGLTEYEDFYITPANTVKVPIMKMPADSIEFLYTEDNRMQLLEMPYKGDDLSMLILLPMEKDLTTLERLIDLNRLNNFKLMDLRRGMWRQKINIWMPKFELRTDYDLHNNLKNMGMDLPFGMDADLSGMDGTKDLYVSQMKHKGFVKVDEEGTEAAAATAAVVTLRGFMPTKNFKVDHPFIYTIIERETGNILFMGRVKDPR